VTRLLASVAGLEEARLALAGGADIVDFKDPRRGALGALPVAVVAECVAALSNARETAHGWAPEETSPLPWRGERGIRGALLHARAAGRQCSAARGARSGGTGEEAVRGASVSPLPSWERGGGEGDKFQHFSEHPRSPGVVTSATVGDLPPDPATLAAAVAEMASTGVSYVKIGFFSRAIPKQCLEALAPLARRRRLVAVLFADLEPDLDAIPAIAGAGFAGAMLDTAGKDGRGLRDCMADDDLSRFVASARQHGLITGLAGSLKASDIPALLPLAPDYLGFRGALCAGASRQASMDRGALGVVRAAIPCA